MGLLKAFAGLLRPFSREGSLSCHTCFDTGPRFSRSHQKDGAVFSPHTTILRYRGRIPALIITSNNRKNKRWSNDILTMNRLRARWYLMTLGQSNCSTVSNRKYSYISICIGGNTWKFPTAFILPALIWLVRLKAKLTWPCTSCFYQIRRSDCASIWPKVSVVCVLVVLCSPHKASFIGRQKKWEWQDKKIEFLYYSRRTPYYIDKFKNSRVKTGFNSIIDLKSSFIYTFNMTGVYKFRQMVWQIDLNPKQKVH